MSRPRSEPNRHLPDNLYRRSDGRLYFRDPRNGRTFSLGRDEAFARAQATEVNAELARLTAAQNRLARRVQGCGPRSLAAWLRRHDEIMTGDESLSDATRVQYRSLSRQLTQALGDRMLSELKPEHISAALEPWRKAGQHHRAHALLAHLRRACVAAIGQGWLAVGHNPTEGLRIKKPGVRRQRLTLDEFHRLHAVAADHEPWVQRWLELAVLTTLRLADLLGLTWSGGPLARGWVDRSHLRVRTSKRGVPLAIPLALSLPPLGPWSIASILAAVEADGVASPRIIRRSPARSATAAGSPITPRLAEEIFGRLIAAAGVEVEPGRTRPTPHELRSLGLRLHRACHGREFARHLGSHESDQVADLYQDPRGSGWLVIPLPTRPSPGRQGATSTAAALFGPREHSS